MLSHTLVVYNTLTGHKGSEPCTVMSLDSLADWSTTVTQSTYDRIKLDIVFGKLSPGRKLTLQLMKKKNITPACRSFARPLTDSPVTDSSPRLHNRGFFVTTVSKQDLIEIAGLRTLLECHAITESIQNGDGNWEGKDRRSAPHKLKIEETKIFVRKRN